MGKIQNKEFDVKMELNKTVLQCLFQQLHRYKTIHSYSKPPKSCDLFQPSSGRKRH